jgi:hypothetical protein
MLEDESSSSASNNDDVTISTHTPVSAMLDRALQISQEMQVQMEAYYSGAAGGGTIEEKNENDGDTPPEGATLDVDGNLTGNNETSDESETTSPDNS